MRSYSRRQLAAYASSRLQEGTDVNQLAAELMASLQESGRVSEIEMLLGDINYELEKAGTLAYARVTTAYPLSDGLRGALHEAIKQTNGVSHVTIDEHTDQNVLGGVHIQTATRTWDATLRRKLMELRKVFTSGAY